MKVRYLYTRLPNGQGILLPVSGISTRRAAVRILIAPDSFEYEHPGECVTNSHLVTAPFTVLPLLTPRKMSYEAAKQRAEPYPKIVEELPEMRRDTVDLVKKAVEEKRNAYVLVNNRSEGNAPLTIQALRNALEVAET